MKPHSLWSQPEETLACLLASSKGQGRPSVWQADGKRGDSSWRLGLSYQEMPPKQWTERI